jgi:hypothetical protein
VAPRPQDQEDPVVGDVLGLDRPVDGERAVDVLLVEQAVDDHHRHAERLGGEHAIDGLVAPEGVVARVRQDLAPEADLLEPALTAERPRGAPRGTE